MSPDMMRRGAAFAILIIFLLNGIYFIFKKEYYYYDAEFSLLGRPILICVGIVVVSICLKLIWEFLKYAISFPVQLVCQVD